MIVIVLLLFLMLALVGGGWFFFLRKKEGDDCEVKSPDDNAVSYEIDADGECVLMTCASGYDKVGQTCVVTPVVPKTPAEIAAAAAAAATSLPSINGLTGHYTTNSFDMTTKIWKDTSGEDNDITDTIGKFEKSDNALMGDYIYGNTAAGFKLPETLYGSQYTFFYVARYNGSKRLRIFDGTDLNWLSGFHNGKTGIAHHEGWLTPNNKSYHGNFGWVLGADARGIFRTFGENRVTTPNNGAPPKQIAVNMGKSTQSSNWAIKEMIVYDRKLSGPQIKQVEEYLTEKYFPGLPEGISKVMGYQGGGLHVYDTDTAPAGYGTAEYCRRRATDLGYAVWAHRTEAHPNQGVRNKCFYYEEGKFDEYTGNENDVKHQIGCVEEGKDIYTGCK